jgi:hypothetical protein
LAKRYDEPERRSYCVALARRKQFQIFEHWSKQLLHSGEGELHLGLDADHA